MQLQLRSPRPICHDFCFVCDSNISHQCMIDPWCEVLLACCWEDVWCLMMMDGDVSVFVFIPNHLISQTLWPFPFPKFHQQQQELICEDSFEVVETLTLSAPDIIHWFWFVSHWKVKKAQRRHRYGKTPPIPRLSSKSKIGFRISSADSYSDWYIFVFRAILSHYSRA